MDAKHSPEYLPPDLKVAMARQRRFYSKLIYRAICDIVNYRESTVPKSKEIHDSAYEWMYNGVETEPCNSEVAWEELKLLDDVMSFETACSALKWDPEWVRARVKRLHRRDLERIGRNGLI